MKRILISTAGLVGLVSVSGCVTTCSENPELCATKQDPIQANQGIQTKSNRSGTYEESGKRVSGQVCTKNNGVEQCKPASDYVEEGGDLDEVEFDPDFD